MRDCVLLRYDDAMIEFATGSIRMTWDADARLARIRFESDTHATGEDARALVGALGGWVGADPAPFGLLGDGRGLRGLDAEYRSLWGSFLRRQRDRCFVAFFHMGPLVRVAADMFRIGTGLQMKAFAQEESARAWLRQMGIDA